MNEDNRYKTPDSELEHGDASGPIYAGFWIRTAASIIDTVFILILTWPILALIYGPEYWTESMSGGVWDILFSYVFPAIVVILFWVYKSATPGKMALGLKVVSLGESPQLSVGQSIGRYAAYYPSMLVLFLGFIWVAFDKRKQGWHDKLANTIVVKRQ